MDRDKRWERVKVAIDGLVKGEGEAGTDVVEKIKERYEKNETDEFLKPIIINGDEGRIKGMINVARIHSDILIRSPQMVILSSSSITVPTECERSSLYSGFQTNLWKLTFPRIS